MDFREFSSPEGNNYDINSSFNSLGQVSNSNQDNIYSQQLMDLVGILEDVTESKLLEDYGITLQEYYQPSEETITKVRQHLGIKSK